MAENVIMGDGSKRSVGSNHGPIEPAHPLPNSAEGLTLELIDRIVSEWNPGTTVTAVELVEAKGLAQQVSTAGRARVRLTYGPGSADLPRDVIVKMVIGEAGVDGALYETEVQMYREVLPGLGIPQIACLGAAYEDETERLVLLLEDLSAKQPFFPLSTLKPLTPDRVAALLSHLAKLHARYWNSPELDTMGSWLGTLLKGRQFDFLNAICVPAITQMAEESTYRADLIARTGWTPEQLWNGVKATHAYHAKVQPRTLVHGDTGAHNTFHLPDGTFGFYDWQLSASGCWAHDVHYHIIESLSIADRKANERALIQHYLDELAKNGVTDAPDIDTAMQTYGRAIIWGFTVGWLLCPERNYDMKIIITNLERLYSAMCDNHTLALVEQAQRDL
ncbi:MAG: phosphotransferase [Novosphingobium sp.]|nr:phosphotransferase [Novosphingobium sp.]